MRPPPRSPRSPFGQWLLLAAALLLLGGALGWNLHSEYNATDARERERLAGQAEMLAQNLGGQLLATNLALDSIRRELPLLKTQEDGKAPVNRRLQSMSDAMPGIRTFLTLDADGMATASNQPQLIGKNFGERDYFRTARQSGDRDLLHVSLPYRTFLGVFAISLSKELPDPRGEFAGIISATLEPEYFATLLNSVLYAADARASIVHGDGAVFLNAPPLPGVDGMNLAQPGTFFTRHRESGQPSSLFTGTVFATGDQRMIALRTIRPLTPSLDRPLVVAMSRDLPTVFAHWRGEAYQRGGMFGALALAAALSLFFHQRRVRAVERVAADRDDERKRAELALRAREERFQALFDRASDGIMIMSSDGRLVAANESFARMHGYAAEELRTLSLGDLDTPETLRLVPTRMQRVLAGDTLTFEVEHRHKDGHTFPLEVSASLILSEGEPLVQSFHRDITERKTAEAALLQRELRLNFLLTATPVVIYTCRASGDVTTFVSENVLQVLGYRPDEFIADPAFWANRVHPADAARVMSGVVPVIEHDRFGHEYRFRHQDGSYRWMRDEAGVVRDAAGQPAELIGSWTDVTERKRAEATRTLLEGQLREAQKMEAIGTLAGGIAHDFNNILATILGNAELARQDVGANPQALQSLEEIRKAGSRARDLVQQILAFSRRQPVERKPVALAPIVEEAVRLLRATLPARLTLEAHCAAGLPPVLADATQIQQVVINLATNAMQAMRDGTGRIAIRLDTVLLDGALAAARPALRALHGQRPGRTVRLAVSDDGPGMDAATLERIFDPFFTTKVVGEGTGLGLAVVHGVVRAHEGAIDVDSLPGKGATFTLYLPAIEVQAGTAEQNTDAAGDVPAGKADGGRHILYLDDDETLVFLAQRLLERRGYRISGYVDPQEALAALRADPAGFDLVVTDYNMPGMSGLDVARAVRAIRADLPVAVASGFIDEELTAQAAGAGVREVIFKAAAAEDLCEAFARLAQAAGASPKRS